MEKLREILNNYPDSTEVSLEKCNLSTLNDVLEYLGKLGNLKVLRLGSNSLTKLPSDMSRMKRLEYLDVSNNSFKDLDDILSGLVSLPSLKHLYITLNEDDEDNLIISMANLQSFNGTPLTDIPDSYPLMNDQDDSNQQDLSNSPKQQALDSNVPDQVEFNETDLESSRKVYEAASLFLGQKPSFTSHASDIIAQLKNTLSGETDHVKATINISNANKVLYDRSFDDIIGAISKNDKKLSSVLAIVKSSYSGLLEDCFSLMENTVLEYNKRVRSLQKDLDAADVEIGQLLEAAEALQQSASDSENTKRKVLLSWEKERESLCEEIGFLKTELEKYKNRLNQFQLNRQKISTQINTSPSKLLKTPQSPSTAGAPLSSSTFKLSQITVNVNTKPLTLRQLKDLIEEIYSSKQKFDEKCAESKLPRETMEQHLYTYLNQKYGLKSIILDYASSIVQGIKRYSNEDNDVTVFGKILRNEIDEEFRFVQKQLKETVAELLKVFIRGKYSKKMDSEIQAMHQQRMSGDVLEEEWVDIVKYMYNKEDSVNVIMKVSEAIQAIQTKLNRGNSRVGTSPTKSAAVTQNKVPFKVFLKVLLTYQLKGHEQFLYKFVKLFRQVDGDRNGVLSEIEFKHLLALINPNRSDSDYIQWLNYVDPYNNQHITFSECVTFMSSELLKLMSEKTPNEIVEEENEDEFDYENNDEM